MSASSRSPDRLGLALAGGGFRAALFHLGVLHRLAGLDILRRVQVLSTVSGGSIVGALYVLRLKKWLEEKRPDEAPGTERCLDRKHYQAIVKEVEDYLCGGISKNLRTRLFLNPLTTLRVMLGPHSLGRAMAELYERHIYARAIEDMPGLEPVKRWRGSVRRGGIKLSDLRIRPGGKDPEGGIDAYNARQVATGGSVITRIVLNATSLNSGGRFLFSSAEVGDWYLGHFRHDQVQALLSRKRLLRRRDLERIARGDIEPPRLVAANDDKLELSREDAIAVAQLAYGWRAHKLAIKGKQSPDDGSELMPGVKVQPADAPANGPDPEKPAPLSAWEDVYAAFGSCFPGDLPDAAPGALRQAKVAAWYLRHGTERGVSGGRQPAEHLRDLCKVLGEIDPALEDSLKDREWNDPACLRFYEYLIELYLVRMADAMSDDFEEDWNELTVGDAVGASACFPPVFPPFVLMGIYDDKHASRLGLTDGGVYDNAGVVALLDEGCTSIIASDTGGVFEEKIEAPGDHVRMTLRLPDILMRAVGGFQRRAAFERRRLSQDVNRLGDKLPMTADCAEARNALEQLYADHELREHAYFHMSSPPPDVPGALRLGLDGRALARLRTDLDGFGDVEVRALVNHGWDTADRFVRRYMKAPITGWPGTMKLPYEPVGGKRVERIIAAGTSRFVRPFKVRAPLAMIVSVGGLLGLAAWAILGHASFSGLWALLAGGVGAVTGALSAAAGVFPPPVAWVLRLIPNVIPHYVLPWIGWALAQPLTLIVAALLGAVAIVYLAVRERSEPSARVHTVWKNISAYAWNVLWLAWLLPLIIAFVCAAVVAVTWGLFYWPWRREARVRDGDKRKVLGQTVTPGVYKEVPVSV